ncbi:MAG: CoA transferase [Deltaproteobacteria bacterium]|nr:CoA transferase [Deltaproteobacteria bacterium]
METAPHATETPVLQGVRIVEFGWAVVGPLTTSWAGNHGAEVIKIETRTRPDIIRSMTPFQGDEAHVDNSLFFGRENASKLSMALNLKHSKAVAIAKRLVASSDAVVESYTAGVMEKWGLGHRDLREVKPDLVMLSSCMYGQTGRLRSMPGYGVPLTAVSGLTYLCGWPDRPPTGPYGSYTDYLVPRFNLLALVSALDYRRRTGLGIHLDASQLEAAVQFVAPALLQWEVEGRIAGRSGNGDPQGAPHGVYRCLGKDRWVAIAVFSEAHWKGLCEALGNPPWIAQPSFSSFEARKANQRELDRHLEEWTLVREAGEAMRLLQEQGVPAGVVNDGRDLGEDPQLLHEGYYRRLEHPRMGPVDYADHSIRFSRSRHEVRRSPCLGEHTEHVCREILGMETAEIESLTAEGVFE